jgi:hypothetical protein
MLLLHLQRPSLQDQYRRHRVLTMARLAVRNYSVGLYLSSKHNVSEAGSTSVFMWPVEQQRERLNRQTGLPEQSCYSIAGTHLLKNLWSDRKPIPEQSKVQWFSPDFAVSPEASSVHLYWRLASYLLFCFEANNNVHNAVHSFCKQSIDDSGMLPLI